MSVKELRKELKAAAAIEQRLKLHNVLMQIMVSEGCDKDIASRAAFKIVKLGLTGSTE